jgi:hypothetical protein
MNTPPGKAKPLAKAAGLEAPACGVIESVEPVWRRERVEKARLGDLMAALPDVDSTRVDVGASIRVTHAAPQ